MLAIIMGGIMTFGGQTIDRTAAVDKRMWWGLRWLRRGTAGVGFGSFGGSLFGVGWVGHGCWWGDGT